MSVQAQQVVLASSAEASIAGNALHGVLRVTVRNFGAGVAYVGHSGITTGSGFQLTTADAPVTFVLAVGEQMFAYSTGTPTIHVLRMNDTT